MSGNKRISEYPPKTPLKTIKGLFITLGVIGGLAVLVVASAAALGGRSDLKIAKGRSSLILRRMATATSRSYCGPATGPSWIKGSYEDHGHNLDPSRWREPPN